MGHDAGAHRRLRGRGVRLRFPAPRQRRHRQRGGHRARRAGRHRRHGPGLPRRLLAEPRHVPGARPGRGAAVRPGQRRLLRRRRKLRHARHPAGRSRADPRSRCRVRVVADGPGRDRRHRAADRGLAEADRRTTQGHRHQRVGHDAPGPGGRPRRHRGQARRPGARRDRDGRRRHRAVPVRPAALRQDRRTGDVRRPGRPGRGCGPPVRTSRHHRPAHVRPELRVHRPAARRRSGDPGLGRRGPPHGRDRGPDAAAHRQRPVLPADRPQVTGTTTFRSDLLRSTVVASDADFFNKDPYSISFGQGSAELAYRPIAWTAPSTRPSWSSA